MSHKSRRKHLQHEIAGLQKDLEDARYKKDAARIAEIEKLIHELCAKLEHMGEP